jgi:hypothetical protein
MKLSNLMIAGGAAACCALISCGVAGAQTAPAAAPFSTPPVLTLTPAPATSANALSVPAPSTASNLARLADDPIYACACGCGVFEVGTASMLPHGQGGMVWLEYDYQDQKEDRHGTSSAPPSANEDTDIRTDFFMAGFQYFFNRKWGVEVEVPVDHRHFVSGGDTADWTAIGDTRVHGLYTGFFEDQSLGIDFGLKLPTGNWTHPGPDRDTEIGTGATDLLLGGYYRTNLTADRDWTFFTQVEADVPVISQEQYLPGFELDSSAGIYYSGFRVHGVTISPVGQVLASYRTPDSGSNSAGPSGSGFERLILSPGVEFHFHPFSVYTDVEIPVFTDYRGDQLAASSAFKVIVSYHF